MDKCYEKKIRNNEEWVWIKSHTSLNADAWWGLQTFRTRLTKAIFKPLTGSHLWYPWYNLSDWENLIDSYAFHRTKNTLRSLVWSSRLSLHACAVSSWGLWISMESWLEIPSLLNTMICLTSWIFSSWRRIMIQLSKETGNQVSLKMCLLIGLGKSLQYLEYCNLFLSHNKQYLGTFMWHIFMNL